MEDIGRGYMCMACKLLYKSPNWSCRHCEKCDSETQRCEHKYCRKCSGELGLCIQCGKEPSMLEKDLKTIDEQLEKLKAPKKPLVINDPMLEKLFANKEEDPCEEHRNQFEISRLENMRKLIDIKDKDELKSKLRY